MNNLLTNDCIKFINKLEETFGEDRLDLLKSRLVRQSQYDNGVLPNFKFYSKNVRDSEWVVNEIPKKLQNRTIEITGSVDRKMIINALNSDANGFMCDFEDSYSPTFENMLQGQVNLRDAIRNEITFYKKDKEYKLKDEFKNLPALHVRPRGLHMVEKGHNNMSASLFDFGVYFFTNAKLLSEMNLGPYFYLPKLQCSLEARWWNQVFLFSQNYLKIPRGTIRATVLIEHICAAFQMDEILYELKEHSAGLNCGRWDYIFSYIKVFNKSTFLPDRSSINMKTHFMTSYVKLLTETCHKRGVHAMGGMAAQIPSKNSDVNKKNFDIVYQDKSFEAKSGMDGTWVAHPGLIEVSRMAFMDNMEGDNQIEKQFIYGVTQFDLLKVPTGDVTMGSIEENVSVSLKYFDNWLQGRGCIAMNSKMEDAATAEISRIQLWNWIQHRCVDIKVVNDLINNEKDINQKTKDILKDILNKKELTEFMTLECYDYL